MHINNCNNLQLEVLGFGVFPIFTIITILLFLLSAYTNPGFIIGNELLQLQKAQDSDLKHNRNRSKNI